MSILVIDGQGGGIGCAVIERIIEEISNLEIIAVGTNAIATSNMIKAGANIGATGENAVKWNSMHAKIIIGPIGIFFANSMAGEISENIVSYISNSDAYKIAIPVNKCHIKVAGVVDKPLKEYIDEVIINIKNIYKI